MIYYGKTLSSSGPKLTAVHCELLNDKGKWYVATPGSVVILKSYQDLTATCRKPETKKVGATTFKSANEGSVWGNVLAGGLIGYAVDASSGAGFSYPPTLNIEMVRGDTLPHSTSTHSITSSSLHANHFFELILVRKWSGFDV